MSPDGRWLFYFTHNANAPWELGWTYAAISRLPWLHALAAWSTAGTWSRGGHFVADPSVQLADPPDHGTVPYQQLGAGIAVTPPAAFAVERRRGWVEAEGTPPRSPDDMWDEQRAHSLRMTKPQRGSDGSVRLEVWGSYAAFRSGATSAGIGYRIVDAGQAVDLPGVQWADWAEDGRLLVATEAGALEVRGKHGWLAPEQTAADLSCDVPAPVESPDEALRWS